MEAENRQLPVSGQLSMEYSRCMQFIVTYSDGVEGPRIVQGPPAFDGEELVIGDQRFTESQWSKIEIFSETAPAKKRKKHGGLVSIPTTRGEVPGPGAGV